MTTSLVQIRSDLSSTIERISIDNRLACKVNVKFVNDEKKNHSFVSDKPDAKKRVFKSMRSYLRKYNRIAALAQRADLTLTHTVTQIKINDAKVKANVFTYTVHDNELATQAQKEAQATERELNNA